MSDARLVEEKRAKCWLVSYYCFLVSSTSRIVALASFVSQTHCVWCTHVIQDLCCTLSHFFSGFTLFLIFFTSQKIRSMKKLIFSLGTQIHSYSSQLYKPVLTHFPVDIPQLWHNTHSLCCISH